MHVCVCVCVCVRVFRLTAVWGLFADVFSCSGFTEVKCPAYKTFPTGVEGGSSDPCKPGSSFQLSSTTNPSCSLKCKAGYEQKGGKGTSMLQCGKDGRLSGALTCTGTWIRDI